jgi:hypothetical protein
MEAIIPKDKIDGRDYGIIAPYQKVCVVKVLSSFTKDYRKVHYHFARNRRILYREL